MVYQATKNLVGSAYKTASNNVNLANQRIAQTSSGANRGIVSPLSGMTGSSLMGGMIGMGAAGYYGGNLGSTQSNQSTQINPYAQPTAPQYPSNLNYDVPQIQAMSWEDALDRANSIYQPQYNSARQRTEKLYADQRSQLPQQLAARGYLNGGKREAGEQSITQNQAMDLADLDNQFESTKQQMADSIYWGSQSRAQNLMKTLLDQQNAKNQATIQKWQADYNSYQKQKDDSNNQLMSWVNYFLQNE